MGDGLARGLPFATGSHPDVVEEHLEEAAFLYGQRRHLGATGRATWDRLRRVEGRFLAHLDGLVVAGPEAWPLVRTALDDGVPDVAHAAVRLRCRAGDLDGALQLAGQLEGAPGAGAVDALVHEAAPGWADRLGAELGTGEPRRVRVAASVAAALRVGGAALLRALDRSDDPETEVALVRALGALRYPPARHVLGRRALASPRPGVARAAESALVRFGDARALEAAGPRARDEPRAALVLGLLGGPPHGARLADAARSGGPGGPVALGVLGDPAHVPLLLDLLDDPTAAEAAALALRVLTGAPLAEEAVVPDDPAAPDLGGDVAVRPSQRSDDWRAWWAGRGAGLRDGTRYRAGRPFAPAVAVSAPVGGLADDLLPAPLRGALADELAGRYGLDAPFRADAFVTDQEDALAALAAAAGRVRAREGAWASRPPPDAPRAGS